MWDRLCRQPAGYFGPTAAGGVKTLDVPKGSGSVIAIPVAQAITAVATDADGDRVFETTWAATDYRLYPLDGPPYRELRVDDAQGRYTLPVGQARLQLTGTWGEESAVPLPVQRAVRLLAGRYRVRPNTPEGITSSGEHMMALGAVDPDILTILREGGYINHRTLFA